MLFLPYLLVLLTGKPRYAPDIEWSSTSWTHNVFRVFELFFGRQVGVRAEMSTWVSQDKTGKVTHSHALHTFESAVAFAESWVRARCPKLHMVRVHIPVLATTGMPLPPFQFPYLLAVAYDAVSSTSSGTVTSGSVSHTCTGSDRVLMGGTASRGTNTAFSYNSNAMTARSAATNLDTAELFTMVSPPTGANNLNATFSLVNWSYGGVSVTGAAGTFGTDGTNTGSSASTTVTVNSQANALVVDVMVHGNGGAPPTATGPNTARWAIGTATVDSGGMSTTPGGASVSPTWNAGGISVWAVVGVSIDPIAGVQLFTLLGVGT